MAQGPCISFFIVHKSVGLNCISVSLSVLDSVMVVVIIIIIIVIIAVMIIVSSVILLSCYCCCYARQWHRCWIYWHEPICTLAGACEAADKGQFLPAPRAAASRSASALLSMATQSASTLPETPAWVCASSACSEEFKGRACGWT